MWIEIDLTLKKDAEEWGGVWKELINSRHIISLIPNSYEDNHSLLLETVNGQDIFNTFTEKCTQAIYNGFLIALQGSPVDLDEWGYIKPLLNEQVEAIHRHMLYQETIASLANCEGLR